MTQIRWRVTFIALQTTVHVLGLKMEEEDQYCRAETWHACFDLP